MTRLTLASQSPRRAKILADLGVAFDVVKTDAPEVSLPHGYFPLIFSMSSIR